MTAPSRVGEPAVVRSAAGGGRARVRTQWLALAGASTVLAGALVAWALTGVADRDDVVVVARPVRQGAVIAAGDLTIAGVAADGAVRGLVPAASIDVVVGRVATIDLDAGTPLVEGMWSGDEALAPGERSVGAVLDLRRRPAGLRRGDLLTVVALDDAAAPVVGTESEVGSAEVRVLDVVELEDGRARLTLAVAADRAAEVAALAATDRLAVVGAPARVPAGAAATSAEDTP